jgi:FkbM family methyltransferase|tara:strand:- start:1430 stop:2167 length:738 start_codon:yes stop_codon:yes gene_type:complete
MSKFKTIEKRIKKFLINYSLTYYFYKIFKIFRNKKKGSYFGEFGEDILVNRFFRKKNNGFYVDIGCYHPIKGSLTYRLHKKGWKGLNVDLSKISIDLFKLARPKDYNIHAAITDFDGETQFFENDMINQQNTLENNGTNLKKIKINAFKLQTLLEKLNIDNIDFLNIDAEGSDYKVISSLDLNKIRPKIICIEENKYNIKDIINGAIQNLMNSNDYFLFSRVGVSSVYIDNNLKGEIKNIINITN